MKSKLKKLNGTAREFEIEVPKETVDAVFSQVLEDIRKTAQVPGFRPGKAPLDVIQKKHQEDIADEVKRQLVPKGYQYALDEHGLDPVSYPEISEVNIGLSGNLTFKAKVDIHPEVSVKKYRGIKVTTEKISVKDEEVEETLERFRNMHADFIDAARPIKKGDFGICDVDMSSEGETIAKKRENMWIEANKDASLLGVGEEIIGLEKGSSKDIEVTLPENYPDKKYAGKKAVFHVLVKDIKEKKLPEVNDELAKKIGKDTLQEAREEIRSQLLERKESNAKINMKNQILEDILKRHKMDLPETIVARQLKVLMEKAENELLQKGVTKEVIEEHKAKLEEQLSKEAENKVKSYFLLDEIANIEKIEVTDEEVDNWMASLAASYNQSLDDVKKYYKEHDLIGGLKEQLREEKTLDFLLSEAVITEKK